MKITVSRIPEEGLRLQYARGADWLAEAAPEGMPVEFTLREVTVSFAVCKVREAVTVEGALQTELSLACSRCLEKARLPLATEFRYTFLPGPPATEEEKELKDEELDVGFYSDDQISLDALVFEQILLQIPMKTLCRDDCRGLCPRCGTNLNAGSCNCRPETGDPRLAVLKHFKVTS